MSTSSSKRVTFKQVLFDTTGNRRTIAEASKIFGKRVVDVAEIAEALDQMKSEVKPLSSPKRVFISYRWGTPAENRWVEELASKLIDRGCLVELDVMQQEELKTTGSLVAKLVRCHVFLMVIDPGYIERVGAFENQALDRGWAYVEFRVSLMLPSPLLRIGLLRAGNEIPRGMTLASETKLGDVIDAKTPQKLSIALDSFFAPWPVPEPDDIRRRCEKLLDTSAKSALQGNHDASWQAAKEAAELIPNVPDVDRFLISASLRVNRISEAVDAAERLLDKEVSRGTHITLATLAFSAEGRVPGVLNLITSKLLLDYDWRNPLVVATVLCSVGQRRAAVGHLQHAFTVHPSLKDFMNDWKEKLKQRNRLLGRDWRRFEPGESLPIKESDFPSAAPLIRVIPFDDPEFAEVGPFLIAPIDVEIGEFPGLAITREYDLTVFARAVLGAGDLLDEAIDQGEPGSHLACDYCGHVIPFLGECHVLCESCGAEYRFPTMTGGHPCTWCDGNRMTLIEPAFDDVEVPCPYCRSGRFRRIEALGNSRHKSLVTSRPAKKPQWMPAKIRFEDHPFTQANARELDSQTFAIFVNNAPQSILRYLRVPGAFSPEIIIDGRESNFLPSLKCQLQQNGVLVVIAELT